MASGIICTMKLDPFYQAFLRSQFNVEEEVFEFPKGHDLLIRLEAFVTRTPVNYRAQDYGENTFRINLPHMEHKNVLYYNYLSDKKQTLFATRIRNYYQAIIHEEISKQISKGFQKDETIICLMEDFNIPSKYEDRIKRDYSRWKLAESQRRFRRKNRKKIAS
jgi:hypothetical protein